MTIQDAASLIIARRPGSGALFCILFMLLASPRAGMAADFWTATGGPYGGTVISVLAVSDDRVFAGTEGGGLYRSADGGDTWTATELKTGSVLALAVSEGGEFFAGTRAGTVWNSTDGGNTWSEVGQLFLPLVIEALLPDADTSGALLAATQGAGIFRSADGGQTWTVTGLNGVTVRSLHRTPQGLLLAGSDDGLRQSTDGGLMWSSAGLENGPIPALSSGSSVGLLAATPTGVFRSVDGGQSWELTALEEGTTRALMVDGENRLFAASETGIFRSSDLGESWTQVHDGTSESSPFNGTQFALALGTDETLYAGTADGVLRSAAGGDSWSPVNTGLGATWIQALASHPNDLAVFAGTAGSGVFTAAAFGEGLPQGGTGGGPWTSAGLANGHISALGVQGANQSAIESSFMGTVFAGTVGGLYSRSYESQPPPWSSNAGANWIPVSDDLHFVRIHAVHIASDGLIFAGTQTGVYQFLTGSWEASGLADSPIWAFAEHPNGDLFAGGPDGLFRSPDNGDTWETFVAGLEGMVIQALAINADGEVVAGTWHEGIFRSPPDAPAFSAQNEGLTVTEGSGNSIFALVATLDGQLFAGHLGGGVFRSIDGGDTWEAVNEGLTHTDIRALILATDGHLYAGSYGGGVFRSVEPQGPAPLPDLLVSEANFLAPFLPGQQGVEVFLNFQNQGALNLVGFDVRVEVMTSDGEIFQVIEEFKTSALNSGDGLGFSFSFDLPGGGPQGAYKVVATIDPEEVYKEADETNNTLVASFEVAWKPPFSNSAIAFASNRNGPTHDIYTMTADGSGPTQLTNALGNDFIPDWSRNGKQIAFQSQRDGKNEIYVMDIDGENEIRVTENTTDDWSPSWAPDGERIAFQSQQDGNDEIYAINVDGTGAVNLTDHPANDVQPDWSPDGERIAFSSNRDGALYVFLMDADGGNVTNLTGSLGLPGQQPTWSPDGEQIALSSGGGIVVVDPDGGQGSVVVYESPKFAGSPTWSPDGQWIAFDANKDGDEEIYAVSLKGNVLVKLTENSFNDDGPSWSPSPLPDLAWKGELEVVGEDGDPPPFDLGELITFTGTIVNQGAGLAEGFAVEALLTGPPDKTAYFGPGLILSGLTLAVGEEISFQHSFQLPSQAPGGNYQLTAILDPDNVVGEADEIATNLPAAKRVARAQERRSTIGANNSIVRGFEVSATPTVISEVQESAVPGSFDLAQNYPNPFNPSTNIRFSLPHETQVVVRVYDSLGAVQETLVNQVLQAGSYNVDYHAAGLASGVYFYRIEAPGFTSTRKFTLLQ